MHDSWAAISANLQKTLDPGVYKVWLEPVKASLEGQVLRLLAPNAFMAAWLERNLADSLRKAAIAALGPSAAHLELCFEHGGGSVAPKQESCADLLARALPPADKNAPAQGVLPLASRASSRVKVWRYSFSDFVVGAPNRMAAAAAREICAPGELQTLFIKAAPGLGKTHLAEAAGREISALKEGVRVAYLTAEEFASGYVAALRQHDLESFKARLDGLELLLLEDVHFFQRKKAMQEMLLAIVRRLQSQGGRLVLTSSFAPNELEDVDGQLLSYFCSGILTHIRPPNQEMRREILMRKAKSHQVQLPDELADLLATRLKGDVRQLESCLKSMLFKAKLLNCKLNMDIALDALSQYACHAQDLDMERILSLVCENFGLTPRQLCSRSRRQECVQARNAVFYLARKHTELSLSDIGSQLNRRHSTVLRSITAIEREISRESVSGRQLASTVSLIERQCGLMPSQTH